MKWGWIFKMPGIKRYNYPTEVIGLRIKKSIKDTNTTYEILKDLGEVFVKLASRFTDHEIEKILTEHPLASVVIEVLP